jgi:hypothetical protein
MYRVQLATEMQNVYDKQFIILATARSGTEVELAAD